MAKSKRILSAILSIAMIFSLIPMASFSASAVEEVAFNTAAVDTGDGKLVVPTVTLESTKVIRVAKDASGATFENGTTIVPATPSGLPQINSGYVSQYYCDETPVSAQIVFTSDIALASTPTISCENNANVTFSAASKSGNTYTWTITGGTGVTVGQLRFVVDYSNSYVDSLTGKTVTNYFKAYTTSYVDTIAQPGSFSAFRTRTGSVGHENVRCSYIVRILGANTYGGFAVYNDEDDASSAHGYYDFIQNFWVDLGTTNQAKGYGTMIYEVSNDSGDGSTMINANADHWRPTSTTYVDRGLGTSLGLLNLRLTQFERQGARKDGYTYYARYGRMKLLEGSVYAHSDAIENNASRLELGLSQDLTSDVQIANFGYTNVPLNGSTYGNSSTLDEATGNYVTEYTLVYSGGSHYSKVDRVANADVTMGIRLESYDKSELRGYINELLVDHDPTTKLAATSEIGIYPQSKFYTDGWDAYKSALQNAQGILNQPNTNQNEINAALSTLETAVDGLVVAEADYSVVEIAKADAASKNALNYTEASWANLQAALDAADAAQGYSVFYQSAVDKLAMDINDAIAALEYGTADWTLVDQAVSVYENLDPSLYTPESWINLRNAVNTAMEEKDKVPAYTVADQEYVNSLAKAISDAIDALEDALADYSDFLDQVRRYEEEILPEKERIEAELAAAGIDIADYGYTSIYDAAKWRRLQAALNFDLTLTHYYQIDVDDATETLKSAIDNLTLANAYYEDVNYWIDEADAIDDSWYTEESYQAVMDAVDAVVTGKKIDEQITVNGYATAIEEAIKNLEYEYADYSKVDKAIERAEAVDPSIYTEDSYNAIWAVVDNIDWNLYAKDQKVVDGYVTAIDAAIANLEELPADYSKVQAAKDRWATYTDTSIYTNASVAAVVNAINAVDYSKTITQQAEVDAMAKAINDAIDNLQEKPADYTALQAAFDDAKAEITKNANFKAANGVDYYTADSLANLQAAINAVPVDASGAIIEDKKLSDQADVDALTTALVNVVLVVNGANYDALDEILLTVPSEEDLERLYTVDSAAALLAAVINANSVDRNLKVDEQATIDALVAEVDAAIKGLEYKPADYTAVENAIAAARAELAKGIWTADSAQAVEDAIADVVYGLDIRFIDDVNAMAEAINAKVVLLTPAYADYKVVDEAKLAAALVDTSKVTPESYAKVEEAVNAVVEGLYAKDQAIVDGYAQAIYDAIDALEYLKADWSQVDALVEEINNLDPSLYANYDEIYWTYLYSYIYETIPAAKAEYVLLETQPQVDDTYALLLAYYEMLEPVALDSIIVEKAPNKVEYNVGDTFDATGLAIFAIYNNGSSATITEGFTLSDVDMSTAGTKTVTVTYEGKTATFEITVIEAVQIVERFEIVGGATVKTQGGVNYIVGLQPSLTKAKFQSTYTEYENVTVEIKMTTARYLGTGSTVTVKSKATGEVIKEYVIVIYGDVDGTATINARDSLAVMNSISGAADSLTGAAKLAANVEGTRTTINA
ncbi:MAG: bacterial Ig-like domain-containing protein, partial [Clostridia bacterium]|nr:bacterial Ig-like domain-containing protein [Clostridia bacterium]